MQISKVHIKNFRCILDREVELGGLTTLVGPNGSGKSAVLRAIDLFYQTKNVVTQEDFYNRDMSQNIEIAITFKGLSEEEQQLCSKYVCDGMLTVTKVIGDGAEKYHGSLLQNPDFVEVRKKGTKSDILDAYRELPSQEKYSELPKVKSADAAEAEMQKWEAMHIGDCTWIRDNGQFFGFRQVGQSHLEKYTRFLFVPAVRDAEQDALDKSGSAMFQLMEFLVRSVMAQQEKFTEFKTRVQDEYSELISPERVPQLKNLGDILTQNLRGYVPSASVKVSWEPAESINMPIPKADVKLEEDGFDAPVSKVGHGLQRAFIISVLQSLIGIQYREQLFQSDVKGNSGSFGEVLPNIILAIEEPELYQHPNRQRHLSRILFELSKTGIAGVAKSAQVIYCTHSPLFVDLSRFDSTRRLTKIPNPSNASLPKITLVAQTNMDSIAKKLESVQDEKPSTPFTSESLKARMVAIMTPWVNEGFFADIAVLVEGEDDRSAIMGTALAMGIDLEAEGIAVIPCGGKENIDRPFLVFSEIGIPVYVVFDGDGHKPENERGDKTNRILQKLLRCSNIRDVPIMEVTAKYATFDTELDRFLRGKIGEEIYTIVANRYIREFGYPSMDQCKKSPAFVCEIIAQAKKKGVVIPELQQIIENIRRIS